MPHAVVLASDAISNCPGGEIFSIARCALRNTELSRLPSRVCGIAASKSTAGMGRVTDMKNMARSPARVLSNDDAEIGRAPSPFGSA